MLLIFSLEVVQATFEEEVWSLRSEEVCEIFITTEKEKWIYDGDTFWKII